MYILFLLITILLLGAYLFRNQIPTPFFRENEKQVAAAAAIATFISGLWLTARIGGFEPKLGVFISMLGLLTLIAKQHSATVVHFLQSLGSDWNPFTHRLFSPVLGWPLFLIGLTIATPPALWIDLIGVAIIYVIAVAYARQKESKP
jgi:hypothetical protein